MGVERVQVVYVKRGRHIVGPPRCALCADEYPTRGLTAPCEGRWQCHGFLQGCNCPACKSREEGQDAAR